MIRDGGGDDEPTRLDADDFVDRSAAVVRDDRVDCAGKCDVVGEQRADVLEQHARLRIVSDITDAFPHPRGQIKRHSVPVKMG